MKIYWIGDRGFIEIDRLELPGIADVQFEKGRLEVKVIVDMNLEDTREIKINREGEANGIGLENVEDKV